MFSYFLLSGCPWVPGYKTPDQAHHWSMVDGVLRGCPSRSWRLKRWA